MHKAQTTNADTLGSQTVNATNNTGIFHNVHSGRLLALYIFVSTVGFFTACIPAAGRVSAADPSFDTNVAPFLKQHCVGCHGDKKQNGERRFDTLQGTIGSDAELADFQDILDQLNLGEMPPANEVQPTDNKRREVISWLTKNISHFHDTHKNKHGESILRRLNAREYRNTIRDLFRLQTTLFDPTKGFPRDQSIEHLDNVGETLVTSGYLLQQYLLAAEAVVKKAIYPLAQPKVQTWIFRDGFDQQPEIDQVHRKTNQFAHMTLYDVAGADKPEGAYGPIHAFRTGVPFDGIYEIRIKAEAVNRLHPYDEAFVGTDKNEPLRLGIVPGDQTVGPLHLSQPIEPLLAEVDLADEVKWYTVRVWLNAGYTPRFTFRNGLMDARNLWGNLVKKYADQFPKPVRPSIVEHRFNAIKFGKLPQIHIHEIAVEGPFFDEWPTKSQKAVFGSDAEEILQSQQITTQQMRSHLNVFAARAFRRPVADDEIDRVITVIQRQQAAGRSSLEAYADGLKAILCSPAFLYLEQPSNEGLSASALASRLAYFLWASMPDNELLQLAGVNTGAANNSPTLSPTLADLTTFRQQVTRMLADEKSDALIDGFLGSWLTLRELGSQPPDRDQFKAYYRFDLGSAMLEETRLFTRHLIDKNLSIDNFLDSNFTFVNKTLAKHYEIDVPAGSGFQKVTITDPRRGGLLGQASVLTVTANGIDTSPVIRGVWLLENMLGTPPSPPPPDVEPLDPDVRGAKTIREQLEKHRIIASCNDCHRRIDPMGFALENFNPIGQWRTTYSKKLTIDASGQLSNGEAYDDIVGFKKIMLSQRELFTRALTTKLLAYALGRTIEAADRPAVDHITRQLDQRGNGMQDLIRLITENNVFLDKPEQTASGFNEASPSEPDASHPKPND